MEFSNTRVHFAPEERFISGLEESVPLTDAPYALAKILRARGKVLGRFMDLLMCDVERLSDEEAESLPLYPERLKALDHMANALVDEAMLHVVEEIEQNPAPDRRSIR